MSTDLSMDVFDNDKAEVEDGVLSSEQTPTSGATLSAPVINKHASTETVGQLRPEEIPLPADEPEDFVEK